MQSSLICCFLLQCRFRLFLYISDMNVPQSIKVLGLQDFETHHSLLYSNVLSDHLRTSHAHIDKPHKHDFYVAMIFTKGYGEHQIDFKTYPVLRGSIFLLTPGQTHHWNYLTTPRALFSFILRPFTIPILSVLPCGRFRFSLRYKTHRLLRFQETRS